MPKVFEVNTANEYWRSHGALVHADLDACADLALPDEMRVYAFAGCQHGAGPPALMDRSPLTPEQRLANPINMLNYTPLNRAVLTNLERWVAEDVAPPGSNVPTVAREELVPREPLVERFRRIPGANVPSHLPELSRFDGADNYPYAVSNVDDDLNEVAGIRMPELAVPLATYAAWNPRHPETGGAGQVADMMGATFPFAATVGDRRRSGDPRKSIEERYRDRDDYCTRVRAEAERMVRERLLPRGGRRPRHARGRPRLRPVQRAGRCLGLPTEQGRTENANINRPGRLSVVECERQPQPNVRMQLGVPRTVRTFSNRPTAADD